MNWYLRELVGCSHSKDGGRNYAFLGADPSKRRIYIPLAPAAPAPGVERWYEELKKLKYEVEHSNDRLKTRFLCMLDAMENRRDDRVILWRMIAPDDKVHSPLGVTKKPWGKGGVDSQWLYDHIKTLQDVAAQPLGDGWMNQERFVLSFHKYLFETPAKPTLAGLREAHDSIVETRGMLYRWADQGLAGSSSMPVAYRAIKEFVHLGERSPGSVVRCLVTIDADPWVPWWQRKSE